MDSKYPNVESPSEHPSADALFKTPSALRGVPLFSCRRTLQISPTSCPQADSCGSYCSDPVATSWKAFSKTPEMQQRLFERRHERARVIQFVISALRKQYRIFLLSLKHQGSKPNSEEKSAHGKRMTITFPVQFEECACAKLFVHVAKHMELLMYRTAFSKSEYLNVDTIERRVDHFALVMTSNPRWRIKLVKRSTPSTVERGNARQTRVFDSFEVQRKRLWLFTPTRWTRSDISNHRGPSCQPPYMQQCVMINGNDHSYRSIVASLHATSTLTSTRHQRLSSTRTASFSKLTALFQGSHSALLINVFAFLEGHFVVQCFSLNRMCWNLLPHAIEDLRIGTRGLVQLLRSLELRGTNPEHPRRVILSNLRHLCVVPEKPGLSRTASGATTGAISDNLKRKRDVTSSSLPLTPQLKAHTVDAVHCPPQQLNARVYGEVAVLELVKHMRLRSCPALRKLCLCSTFVNSVRRNGIYYLIEALKEGACQDLEYLWLGGNALGDYGAMKVSELLLSGHCPRLVFLDLRSNSIGHGGLRTLAQALLATPTQLQQLCLGSNLITDDALSELLPCMRHGALQSLVYLGLDRNFLTAKSMEKIALEMVSSNCCPSLRELCIGGNAALSPWTIKSLFRRIADAPAASAWGLFQANLSGVMTRNHRVKWRRVE